MKTPGSVLLVALAGGLLLIAGCGKQGQAQSSSAGGWLDYAALRADVVKQVQNDALQPDAAGAASLPSGLAPASTGGKVFIAKEPSAGLLVLFNAAQGAEAVLYAEKPLALKTKLKIGSTPLTVLKQMEDHWYAVLCM
jgi:hypothetical protein